jgi:hypothetical protein
VQALFIVSFCQCCPRKRKKEKKVLLPTGVSKSTAHALDAYERTLNVCGKVSHLGNGPSAAPSQ